MSARSRKQIRHRPNLRMYPRALPQTWQRWYPWVLNFGVFWDLRIRLSFAN